MTATVTSDATAWRYPGWTHTDSATTRLDINERTVEQLLTAGAETLSRDVALHLLGIVTHRTPDRAAELADHLLDLADAVADAEDGPHDPWHAAVDEYEGTLYAATRPVSTLVADQEQALEIVNGKLRDELAARRSR